MVGQNSQSGSDSPHTSLLISDMPKTVFDRPLLWQRWVFRDVCVPLLDNDLRAVTEPELDSNWQPSDVCFFPMGPWVYKVFRKELSKEAVNTRNLNFSMFPTFVDAKDCSPSRAQNIIDSICGLSQLS